MKTQTYIFIIFFVHLYSFTHGYFENLLYKRNDQLRRVPYKDKMNDLDYLMRVHRTQQQRKAINYPKGLKSIPKPFKNKLPQRGHDSNKSYQNENSLHQPGDPLNHMLIALLKEELGMDQNSPKMKQTRRGRRIPNNLGRRVDKELTYQNPTIAYEDFSMPIYTNYNSKSVSSKRNLNLRKNAHSRYREGDPILHVKEIVDSPIYLRRGAHAALKHIHTLKDKVAAQNAHLGQIDEVRNDIYRASKKNFATTRKTSDVLRYYDSQIKIPRQKETQGTRQSNTAKPSLNTDTKDYESFNGYLNWFNQNENDIQNFSSNLPEIVNNLDDDDESFYSKHVGDYKLPPFPPLFDFREDGNDDNNDYNYDYDDSSNYSHNSSNEIEYTPSKDKNINRNGEVQTSGFYASQNADHDLRHNMPLYTGYFSDNLEEELNSQKLSHPQYVLHEIMGKYSQLVQKNLPKQI